MRRRMPNTPARRPRAGCGHIGTNCSSPRRHSAHAACPISRDNNNPARHDTHTPTPPSYQHHTPHTHIAHRVGPRQSPLWRRRGGRNSGATPSASAGRACPAGAAPAAGGVARARLTAARSAGGRPASALRNCRSIILSCATAPKETAGRKRSRTRGLLRALGCGARATRGQRRRLCRQVAQRVMRGQRPAAAL